MYKSYSLHVSYTTSELTLNVSGALCLGIESILRRSKPVYFYIFTSVTLY